MVNFGAVNNIRFNNGSGVFFTSDTHFGHENIIKYCQRPFDNVEQMNEAIIKNWNSVVGPNDTVFHLGDFAWGDPKVWNDALDKLNGHIHLILGNHDMKNIREGYMDRFESVSFQKQIYIGRTCIYLNHYPFLCYAGTYSHKRQVWDLFGHVHSNPEIYDFSFIDDMEVQEILVNDHARLQYLTPTQYDVGVDNNDFTPVSFDKVNKIINKQIDDFAAEYGVPPFIGRLKTTTNEKGL